MQEHIQENRIPTHTAGFMLAVAAFYDALQILFNAILIGFLINWAVSLVSFLTFYLWFKLHGVSLGDTVKKIALWVGDYMLDLVSGGIFPSIFISTLVTIIIVKSDDALRNKGVDLNLSVSDSYRKKVIAEEKRLAEQAEATPQGEEEYGEEEEEGGEKTKETEAPREVERFSETLSRVASLQSIGSSKEGVVPGRAPSTTGAKKVIPNQAPNPQNNNGILGRIGRQ